MVYKCFASCSFGLESAAALELKQLGLADVTGKDARVYFSADESGIAKANVNLRTADRVFIQLNEFSAATFDELYEGVKLVNFEDFMPKDVCFPVDADAVTSTLMSVSDIQSVSKKAVVDRLMAKYKTNTLSETGIRCNIHIKILRNNVSVCLNTSGAGLNRRGYRQANVSAPIRETLAAGIVLFSGFKGGVFSDPMCGSGTIAIEAAMIAQGIAPGLNRRFDAQYWAGYASKFNEVNERAKSGRRQYDSEVFASDIDSKVLSAADLNAKAAGAAIKLYHADISDFKRRDATVVTNPPYAKRLGQAKEVHELYHRMGIALKDNKRNFIITADSEFERYFGKRADKKRKLYNGNIRCTLFQYF